MNDDMNSKFYESMNKPAALQYSMGNGVPGSFDGIKLKPKGDKWRKDPSNMKPLKGKFYVPQGTPLPLAHEVQYVDLPKDSMFYFDKNQNSNSCCSATFSTSTGCVCTTKEQRDFIGQHRGGNKNYYDDSF